MSYEAVRDASPDVTISNIDAATAKASDWASVAKAKRLERAARIPAQWILPKTVIDKHAARPISAFEKPIDPAISPGVMSDEELQLTSLAHDATALCGLLRTGAIGSEQLVVAFCKRAAIAHQLTNCLSEIMFHEAIANARSRDAARKEQAGTALGQLHGLPVTVKDCYHVKGYDSSIGITARANKPRQANSEIVNILQQSGAIVIAKTTVPQTCLCAETISIVFGRTCNAYRGDFTAAGSTGGEGTLLAMGGTPLGIGGDGGGSTRMPAFVNGVIGYRPSGYRYPLDGEPVVGAGSMGISSVTNVTVIGPLCRSVRDARMLTKVVSDAEPWEKDAMLLPSPWLGLEAPNRPLRIGVWHDFDHVHLMPPVLRGFQLAQDRLKAKGHELVPFKGPSIANVWDHLQMQVEVLDLRYIRDLISTEPMTESVRRTGVIVPPTPRPKLTLDLLHSVNITTSKLVVEMTKAWNEGAKALDALLWLPAPHPAVPFDEYNDLTFTGLFNTIDWPAIVLPLVEFINTDDVKQDFANENELFGPEDKRVKNLWDDHRKKYEGLPLNIQLIGRRGQDEKLLAIAELVQDIIRS